VRSSLAAIVGYAELLRTRDDDEIRREAPEAISTAAAQLSTAVDALIAATAPE
jgi:signal transduction histidine kinase